mgnify:CR=1 FL=1
MDIMQCRLTDKQITVAAEGVSFTPGGWQYHLDRAIADAATEKALRCVLVWLQEFEDTHSDSGEKIISIGRGHGLEMAAEELEELLAVDRASAEATLKRLNPVSDPIITEMLAPIYEAEPEVGHMFIGRHASLDEALPLSGKCQICGKGYDSH